MALPEIKFRIGNIRECNSAPGAFGKFSKPAARVDFVEKWMPAKLVPPLAHVFNTFNALLQSDGHRMSNPFLASGEVAQ